MRDALFQELHTRGWGRDGRAKDDRTKDLRGFVRIMTLAPIVKASGGEVQREAGRVVGRVVRMSEEAGRGNGRG